MQIANTTEKFGLLTKSLHWIIFVLVIVEYFLVYRREYFPKGSLEKSQYMMLHKSFGLCVLLLALLMLISRYIGRRPLFPLNMRSIEIFFAKSIHFLLYALLLIQPISGILMSSFGGYPIPFFNWFKLPISLPTNKALGEFFYDIHVWTSYFIIAIVAIHILAALYHQYIKKDGVLKRML